MFCQGLWFRLRIVLVGLLFLTMCSGCYQRTTQDQGIASNAKVGCGEELPVVSGVPVFVRLSEVFRTGDKEQAYQALQSFNDLRYPFYPAPLYQMSKDADTSLVDMVDVRLEDEVMDVLQRKMQAFSEMTREGTPDAVLAKHAEDLLAFTMSYYLLGGQPGQLSKFWKLAKEAFVDLKDDLRARAFLYGAAEAHALALHGLLATVYTRFYTSDNVLWLNRGPRWIVEGRSESIEWGLYEMASALTAIKTHVAFSWLKEAAESQLNIAVMRSNYSSYKQALDAYVGSVEDREDVLPMLSWPYVDYLSAWKLGGAATEGYRVYGGSSSAVNAEAAAHAAEYLFLGLPEAAVAYQQANLYSPAAGGSALQSSEEVEQELRLLLATAARFVQEIERLEEAMQGAGETLKVDYGQILKEQWRLLSGWTVRLATFSVLHGEELIRAAEGVAEPYEVSSMKAQVAHPYVAGNLVAAYIRFQVAREGYVVGRSYGETDAESSIDVQRYEELKSHAAFLLQELEGSIQSVLESEGDRTRYLDGFFEGFRNHVMFAGGSSVDSASIEEIAPWVLALRAAYE